MDIQRTIGADIMMAFDECTPWPCEYDYARRSLDMTHRWLKRCITRLDSTEPLYGYEQTLFPIVQGSTFKDLRVQSAEFIAEQDRAGLRPGARTKRLLVRACQGLLRGNYARMAKALGGMPHALPRQEELRRGPGAVEPAPVEARPQAASHLNQR